MCISILCLSKQVQYCSRDSEQRSGSNFVLFDTDKVPKWETPVFEACVELNPMKSFLLAHAFMSFFHVESSLISASEWEQRYYYVHVSHMFVNEELRVPAMALFYVD